MIKTNILLRGVSDFSCRNRVSKVKWSGNPDTMDRLEFGDMTDPLHLSGRKIISMLIKIPSISLSFSDLLSVMHGLLFFYALLWYKWWLWCLLSYHWKMAILRLNYAYLYLDFLLFSSMLIMEEHWPCFPLLQLIFHSKILKKD